MNTTGVIERVERIAAVRAADHADASLVQSGLVAVREIRAWCDAQQAGLVAQLNAVSSFPESAIADADRCSLGAAGKTKERSQTLGATPNLADALEDGAITAGHIDAVTRTSKTLDADQRDDLLAAADELADVAASATVDEFRRRLELEAKRLQRGDGMDRLDRQRRATSLRSWVDAEGMWNLKGRFDPVTGVALAAKLDNAVETLFAQATPDTAPDDPFAKQDHLRALALVKLVEGAGSGMSGRVEWVAVIDADAPHQPGPVGEVLRPHAEDEYAHELAALAPSTTGRARRVAAVAVGGGHLPARRRAGRRHRHHPQVRRPTPPGRGGRRHARHRPGAAVARRAGHRQDLDERAPGRGHQRRLHAARAGHVGHHRGVAALRLELRPPAGRGAVGGRARAVPVFRAMRDGAIARVEELTRMPSDVQDALVSVLSEKVLPIPELDTEVAAVRAST
jgi:hypothetical protein